MQCKLSRDESLVLVLKIYTWKNRVSVADADGVFGKVMMMMLLLSWMLLTHIGTGSKQASSVGKKEQEESERRCGARFSVLRMGRIEGMRCRALRHTSSFSGKAILVYIRYSRMGMRR